MIFDRYNFKIYIFYVIFGFMLLIPWEEVLEYRNIERKYRKVVEERDKYKERVLNLKRELSREYIRRDLMLNGKNKIIENLRKKMKKMDEYLRTSVIIQ